MLCVFVRQESRMIYNIDALRRKKIIKYNLVSYLTLGLCLSDRFVDLIYYDN